MAAVTSGSRTLVVADRWFRGWGVAALLALLATGAMLALSLEAWRAPFVLAHLCALLALVPLGVVLVARTFARYREERGSVLGGVRGTLAHDRLTTLLVAVALVAVAVSLSQFDGGVRAVRSAANLTTVAVIVALVGRYLHSHEGRIV
jgi:MFS family permease